MDSNYFTQVTTLRTREAGPEEVYLESRDSVTFSQAGTYHFLPQPVPQNRVPRGRPSETLRPKSAKKLNAHPLVLRGQAFYVDLPHKTREAGLRTSPIKAAG